MMSYNDLSSTDNGSDQAWNDLLDNLDLLDLDDNKGANGLEDEWNAIEQTLYLEDDPPALLKPALYNECHLWRSSFPYLRVRGRAIEDPNREKKIKLKHRIVSCVVDSIIDKMNAKIYENRNQIKVGIDKNESYFERGKKTPDAIVVAQGDVNKVNRNIQTEKITLDTSTRRPRGILKNSPNRRTVAARSRDRTKIMESTTSSSSSLPQISTKTNVWMARSENCRCGAKSRNQRRGSKLILPALPTPLNE